MNHRSRSLVAARAPTDLTAARARSWTRPDAAGEATAVIASTLAAGAGRLPKTTVLTMILRHSL